MEIIWHDPAVVPCVEADAAGVTDTLEAERSKDEALDPSRRRAGRRAAEFFGGLLVGLAAGVGVGAAACLPHEGDKCSEAGIGAIIATAPMFTGLGIWLGGTAVGPDRTASTMLWDVLATYMGVVPGAAVLGLGAALNNEAEIFGIALLLTLVGAFAGGMYAHERQLRSRHRLRLTPTIAFRDGVTSFGLAGAL